MAVHPILIQGEPVLHARASRVEAIDDSIVTLVADLYDTMAAAPGVGLAAPQIGAPLRLFVYDWTSESGVRHRGEAINPVLLISPPSPEPPSPEDHAEGCLSFPGERFPLQRADHAVLTAVGLNGEEFTLSADGWLARILQHEYDHLNGLLYVDRLRPEYAKRAAKIAKKRHWDAPGQSWMPGVDDLDA